MAIPRQPGFDLSSTYLHLADGGGGAPIEVTPTFWQELTSGDLTSEDVRRVATVDGWLVTRFHITADTAHWEMHPAGDEFLYMLSGASDIVLQEQGGERVVELRPGTVCKVPRGAWHRLVLREPGDLMGITYGKGTQHRPL
ncbi:cupin [Sorangium cellulosum]|uniref:Cupin n=1 Tax=Sorangium cellulosum TaxID=56 RepID=A0A2L0F0B6_SORCE|nr:cupin domain-containing protein [Sorangium cellulosum]AUX45007.1 cupin [Sorangium cellulosum]